MSESLCAYCGRVLWGNVIYLGNDRYRHEECAPGSIAWCEYYATVAPDKRTAAGDILYRHAMSRGLI